MRKHWAFSESVAVYTNADRELELAVNARIGRGRVAVFSTPKTYALVFIHKGRSHTVEQDMPFDADEIVAKAAQ
jgi:hypothetical protein